MAVVLVTPLLNTLDCQPYVYTGLGAYISVNPQAIET